MEGLRYAADSFRRQADVHWLQRIQRLIIVTNGPPDGPAQDRHSRRGPHCRRWNRRAV
jgi:hypothetical protein